jgi:ABC-type thiamine transport system ATPase subunit
MLDQPFSGMDESLHLLMMRLILEFCRSGMTMVMTLRKGEGDTLNLVDPLFCRYDMDHGQLEPRITESSTRSVA